jgi:tetratricopeptide (TPR) repeat protein
MSELSIRFTSENDAAPIFVSLTRVGTGTYTNPVEFTPPLDDAALADLRWYLEIFSTWPSGPDYERAERIENALEDWGRALLESVTRERDAARLWQQFLDDANVRAKHSSTFWETSKNASPLPAPIITIDATDPRVLRLPWELLADDGGHIFARGVSIRRRLQQATTIAATPSFELPVRILVVTARPDDVGFIDTRAVARPLLDALDALEHRVAVEFLYPPTLAALSSRLNNRALPRVHVVHFDGHGVYDETIGLGYLLFEDDAHNSDRVDANRLGTLLYNCGIPLMTLNACQSAAQKEANPYASVAARLIRAGVGSVLAMNYSVLVVAAQKFVGAFYRGLVEGATIGQAVERGRRELLADEKRHTLTRTNADGEKIEETIRLRDWFLPALYQQSVDPIVFPEAGEQRSRGAGEKFPFAPLRPSTPADLPREPLHGFHGRARELLRLERAFAEHPIVILHGFGGIGKTALAAEAGRWFQRTGRFSGGAAFVSFEGGGSLQQLCSWVGQTISRDPNFAIGAGDPVARIAEMLRAAPALVILDNFESVLGREPLMPADELCAVLDAVWMWATLTPSLSLAKGEDAGRGSRILITTRDTTFHDSRFTPSRACTHVELGGLALSDALDLAAATLNDYGIDRAAIRRQDLEELIDHLGGHPLSLYLILPQLRYFAPKEIIARLAELLPGFTTGAAKARNESLQVSLDYSLTRLGEQTRAALPNLAVFQGGAMEHLILAITQIDENLWKTARAELEQAALISAESLRGIKFPFLCFHPTLAPYLATQLPAARRAELETRYWQVYYSFANRLYKGDTEQHPLEARAIAIREMPNFRHALDLAIAAGAVDEATDLGARTIAHFLNQFGRWRERDAMLKQVEKLQIKSEKGITHAEYLWLSQQGEVLRQQGRAAEAERLFRDLLARLEQGAAYDAAYDHALVLQYVGHCVAAQGRPAQAIEWDKRALQEFELLSAMNENAKHMMGACYCDWANNLTSIGQFDEAQKCYESALEIAREMKIQREVGSTLSQLGTLAMKRGDVAEAAKRYNDALNTFRALNEPQMEAAAWHHLGRVAQEAEDWDEAERCYREAVRIHEQISNLSGLAESFSQLALVAQGAGRLEDAERWYLRAIELGEQLRYYKELGKWLNNLTNLYLSQRRLDEAARYARRAVEIKETLDLSAEPWTTYSILARIAEACSNTEAAEWRRKAQDSFAAFAGAAYQLPQWAPQVIQTTVAAMKGNAEARKYVEGELPKMEAGGLGFVKK